MKIVSPSSSHFLLVEDNALDAMALCEAVQKKTPDCTITVVKRGEEALSALLKDIRSFSLIIVGSNIPDMSGQELCHTLIQHDIGQPIVMLTEGESKHLDDEALELGIVGSFAKDGQYDYLDLLPFFLDDIIKRFAKEQALKAEEEARRTAEARYKAVVEDHTDAICRFDPDGHITFFNEACRQFLQDERHACVINFFEAIPLFNQTSFAQATADITTESPTATMELEIPQKNRSSWFQWKIRGLFDSDNTIREYQATGRDVTDLKNTHNKQLILNELLAKQNAKLKELALTDQLTGVANRRNLYSFAEEQWSRAVRKNEEFSIALLDIDHFKNINDTYGHLTGDKVLSLLGGLLRDNIRDYDRVGRWGGEEFMIVLPGTAFHDSLVFAERIRQIVADQELTIDDGQKISFTISLGVAGRLPQGISRLEKLFQLADEALYEAKQRGRNRVCAYSLQ
ncbi:diguanylate cyclase [Desulfovibrio inopinatus]|uniref:diguanylate cyclase n=1 Tax=Desulfovibrio inopinatus TaxID=102109 RepID=UPI00040CBAC8|nr:diguanylate cyclase [Desulfovibrio inopinatus]